MSRMVYEIEVRHDGLNKYRQIRGSDPYVVEQKAIAQTAIWEEMWRKKEKIETARKDKLRIWQSEKDKKADAIVQTNEAREAIANLEGTLAHTLTVNDAIDWDKLMESKPYDIPKPNKKALATTPIAPSKTDTLYQPYFTFFDYIFPNLKKKKVALAESRYLNDFHVWNNQKEKIEKLNELQESIFAQKLKDWEEHKSTYEAEAEIKRKEVINKKEKYFSGKEPTEIIEYCDLVLTFSKYPDYFPQDWDMEYIPDTKTIIIDYSLPNLSSLPRTKAVKYITGRKEFEESYISDSELNRIYDNLIYQITLRTIHELYEADVIDAIESIVFNGWVKSIDKGTGRDTNSCIVSIQASKDEFMAINLAAVEPKACFKQLKGVGSSKLHGLTSIAPIHTINKEDRRFISAYAVADQIDESENLALMDWQDFENLIRELFEKEFSSNGGEVKITQASRDGGVDAVAFDPDPIRGGKIVIQAKRYSNAVGVSAVRDLYGTTMNEGATKGILVTTADFGPDAYDFAKGKPLTLLNGANLLYLLEKHGHRARIDLKEAKQILANNKSPFI